MLYDRTSKGHSSLKSSPVPRDQMKKEDSSKSSARRWEGKATQHHEITARRQATGKRDTEGGTHIAFHVFLADPHGAMIMLTPTPRNNLDRTGHQKITES